jgi:hypothetical protein
MPEKAHAIQQATQALKAQRRAELAAQTEVPA